MPYPPAPYIKPERTAAASLLLMRLAIHKELHLGERSVMTFLQGSGGLVPKEIAMRPVHVAPQECGPAIAVSQKFVDTASARASLPCMRVETPQDRSGMRFANLIARRIDACEQGGQPSEEHVKPSRKEHPPVTLAPHEGRESNQCGARLLRHGVITEDALL
jgi:hypothetical protein